MTLLLETLAQNAAARCGSCHFFPAWGPFQAERSSTPGFQSVRFVPFNCSEARSEAEIVCFTCTFQRMVVVLVSFPYSGTPPSCTVLRPFHISATDPNTKVPCLDDIMPAAARFIHSVSGRRVPPVASFVDGTAHLCIVWLPYPRCLYRSQRTSALVISSRVDSCLTRVTGNKAAPVSVLARASATVQKSACSCHRARSPGGFWGFWWYHR